MRIRLDPDSCVGHGRCYALDPVHFEPDELGHCRVVRPDAAGEELDRVRRAIDACPEGALVLDD